MRDSQQNARAVIKVGSTSVSALVAQTLSQPLWTTSIDLGLLKSPDPVALLEPTLDSLLAQLSAWAPLELLVATGEIGRRRADVVTALCRRGLKPWILTGTEEARVAWWGEQARHGTEVVVIDVGGGSTEVVGARWAMSFPFGAQAPPNATTIGLPAWPGGNAIAIGGTAKVIARWLGRSAVRVEDLQDLSSGSWSVANAIDRLGITPLRARLLPAGAFCLSRVLESLGLNQVQVSPRDLREGLWIAAVLGRGLGWNPR